jgi:hypothetical protein
MPLSEIRNQDHSIRVNEDVHDLDFAATVIGFDIYT